MVATFLLSHINVVFRFILVWINLSKILSKHGGFECTNIIVRSKLICFNEIISNELHGVDYTFKKKEKKIHTHMHSHTHTHMYIYIYIYI